MLRCIGGPSTYHKLYTLSRSHMTLIMRKKNLFNVFMRRKSKTVIFLYAFNHGEWSNEKCKHAKIEMRQNEVTQKKNVERFTTKSSFESRKKTGLIVQLTALRTALCSADWSMKPLKQNLDTTQAEFASVQGETWPAWGRASGWMLQHDSSWLSQF